VSETTDAHEGEGETARWYGALMGECQEPCEPCERSEGEGEGDMRHDGDEACTVPAE